MENQMQQRISDETLRACIYGNEKIGEYGEFIAWDLQDCRAALKASEEAMEYGLSDRDKFIDEFDSQRKKLEAAQAEIARLREAAIDLCDRAERARGLIREACDRFYGPTNPKNNNWGMLDTSRLRAAVTQQAGGDR